MADLRKQTDMDDVSAERWLPVPDYEGCYEVSSAGQVRSLTRWDKWNRIRRGRVLAQHLGNAGTSNKRYLTVGLSRDGKRVTKRVHQLVAAAFLGPCPPGQEVCHGPNGAFDNSVSNLSYGTHAKNSADTIRDGTSTTGIKNASAKLTEADVIEIRRRHANGEGGYRALGREYGVDMGQIRLIVKRRNWKHVA